MRKKKEARNPTPELGVPHANRQMFTVSENKLLDQITLEICEAWAKDLKTIRKVHQETQKTVEYLTNTSNLLSEINDKVELEGFFAKLEEVFKVQEQTRAFLEDVRQRCFRVEEQVLGMRDLLVKALDKVQSTGMIITIPPPPRKWWQFWTHAD